MEERIFLAVIVSAMAVLVGSATMLVFGTANSVALVRQPQQQTPHAAAASNFAARYCGGWTSLEIQFAPRRAI